MTRAVRCGVMPASAHAARRTWSPVSTATQSFVTGTPSIRSMVSTARVEYSG